MDYLSKNVAVNLKRTRQARGMSLDQVAEQTGVSKSMLAQIERGTANPSLGVLGKITSGLRIEFQELIQSPRVDCCLVTPQELLPTKELEGQYRVWTCLPYEDTRLVEVYRIEVEPGGTYVRYLNLRRIRVMCTETREQTKPAVPVSFWITTSGNPAEKLREVNKI